ncbi:hypothetical protein N7474_006849 [Penicillium riverlandense]|uniref:uncharacterized protein n=1 Tax=Penicillium riverlandense TaxID=1903569 RepID=UPI002546B66E|nr:uncharacterized protein N7474_006849 [Penicillium riverlandense]KAJ5815072.1 hypothetical protein N7474_006849 [Penicillium riverlandense]
MQDSREAILNHRINSARDALIVQIKNYGNTILDKPVDESQVGYSYSDHANSGPAALKGGAFANQYSADNHTNFANNVKGTLVSGPLSWIWEKEQVYIVKDSYSINGKSPADLDLDSDVSNRTCSNNGTCYWFIKNTGISDPAEDVFDPVPGFDSLQKWGLQPLDVAMAAETSQNAGGYLKNWTVPETLPFLRGSHGSKPPKALMINLPVCSLDFMHSSWPDQSDAGMDGLDWDDSVS